MKSDINTFRKELGEVKYSNLVGLPSSEIFVIISLRHTYRKSSSVFTLYGHHCNGYSNNLNDCGIYTLEDAKKYTDDSDVLVYMSLEDTLKFRLVIDASTETDMRVVAILPNVGDVRKFLGITEHWLQQLDYNGSNYIHRDCYHNIVNTHYKNSYVEEYRQAINKGHWVVEAKDSVYEHYFYSEEYDAKTRGSAIHQAYKDWDGFKRYDDCTKHDKMSYIEFKSNVACNQTRIQLFRRWRKVTNGR